MRFRKTENEAIFILFLGAVNHWVTMIVYKEKGVDQKPKFYLLDSANLTYLNKAEEQLASVMEERAKEKVLLGFKPSNEFMLKMSIHSLFD